MGITNPSKGRRNSGQRRVMRGVTTCGRRDPSVAQRTQKGLPYRLIAERVPVERP